MKIFASHNHNDNVRHNSSAGGVFSILSEKIIAEGGVVYGAAFNNDWNVVHIRVDTRKDLHRLQGSKYAFSDYLAIMPEIEKDLCSKRVVLFSGTPCQVAVIKKRFRKYDNLKLVEVFCHGAPMSDVWDKYIEALCKKHNRRISDIESINFRDKRRGWKNYNFTVEFKGGKIFTEPHQHNLYI